MATIVSSIVFTRDSLDGTRWTEGYFLYEFRAAGYVTGGEAIDLTPYFRRVEFIQAQAVSGALDYLPRPNAADFPGNAGSGRMELTTLTSAQVTLNISGLAVALTSGTPIFIAGPFAAISGVAASGLVSFVSGRLVIGASGVIVPGSHQNQVLSGVAVSGVRAYIHALGY